MTEAGLARPARLPPQEDEWETPILATLILSPQYFYEIAPRCSEDMFLSTTAKLVFRAVSELGPLEGYDPFRLSKKLSSLKPSWSWLPYLSRLRESGLDTRYPGQLVKDVRDRWNLRRLKAMGEKIVRQASQPTANPSDLLSKVESAILRARASVLKSEPREVRLSSILDKAIDEMCPESDGGGAAIPFGLERLDSLLHGGIRPGKLVIAGARTSVGKSAFATFVATNIAAQGIPVCIFSLEMSAVSLAQRILARENRIRPATRESLQEARDALKDYNLWLDDTPALSIQDILARARYYQSAHEIEVAIVDYVQKVHGYGDERKRYEEIGRVSSGLHQLARETGLAVIAPAQVGRQAEDRAPKLSDLRESGNLEQDADVVIFLHRKQVTMTPEGDTCYVLETRVAKNRDGETGKINLSFYPATMEFS